MKKIALITGATAGIGLAVAERLAQDGYQLIITGRRNDKLEALRKDLQEKYSIDVLALNFDVRSNEAVRQYLGNLPEQWQAIDVLVNNAGLAVGLNKIQDGVVDDWERMIDTNIKGLLYVSRVILPMMAERKKGHVVNIGSIAGKEVYPNGNVYCGTKHAVDALTKSMRIDMVEHGVKVTGIHPGAVETEFSVVRFKGDEEKAKTVYQGYDPLLGQDIADAVSYAVSRPAHVNIADMIITPTAQANAVTVVRK